jgi:superfamily II DNA helicase RecQ
LSTPFAVRGDRTHIEPHDRMSIAETLTMCLPENRVPRPFQVRAVSLLIEGGKTVAVTAPTGSGKSLILHGTAILKRGVAIIFEPLLSVAADQAREFWKGIPSEETTVGEVGCVHLDFLDPEQREEVFQMIQELNPSSDISLVVYTSAESFQKYGRPWKKVVDYLLMTGLLRLVCLDEAHMFVDERHYRPMADLKAEIFDKIKTQKATTAILCMTATFLVETRDRLQQMYGIDFDEYICEPMARRNLELHLHVKPNASKCTKEVKAIVKGQLAIEGRKVIIFEHSAEKCNSLAETIGVSLAAENVEAISLTGREGRVFKQYVVHTFCDDNSTTKVLIGTAAIKCGINCRSCGTVVQVGFPVDIQTYAQQIGRAGRGDIEDPNNPYECHSIVSVHGFNYTFLQICETEDKHVKLEKMLAFQESLELFVIPCGCIHQAMELRLEALGQAMNNGDVEEVATTLGPACQKCWYCRKENMLPVSSHELLRGLLECRLSDGPIPSENLGTFLFKSKA